MKDKFEIGNILCHAPSKSRWIITEKREVSYKQTSFWRMKVRAYCIYSPPQQRARWVWKVNARAEFVLQDKDLNPKDKLWQVLHAESI